MKANYAALLCVFALVSCQQDPPAQGARDSAVPALSAEGYGPAHIGMTWEEARAATGAPLLISAENDPNGCIEQQLDIAGGDKIFLMFEGGKLTRVTATELSAHVRTAQNVGVGSTDAEVRTAYQNVREEGAHYSPPPAHNLIVWTDPDISGLLFEVDEHGKVTSVHAGGPSILYMEGCS